MTTVVRNSSVKLLFPRNTPKVQWITHQRAAVSSKTIYSNVKIQWPICQLHLRLCPAKVILSECVQVLISDAVHCGKGTRHAQKQTHLHVCALLSECMTLISTSKTCHHCRGQLKLQVMHMHIAHISLALETESQTCIVLYVQSVDIKQCDYYSYKRYFISILFIYTSYDVLRKSTYNA